jgi:hypothetical protein
MKLMQMLAVAALLASSHLVYGQQETDVMSANIPFATFLTSRPRALHKAPAVSALLFDRDAAGYTLLQFQQQAQTDAAEIANPGPAERRGSTTQQVASVMLPAR